ncbi:MAG: AttH component of AttEFGH ABC transport system [Burkholderiaceae bacterium]|jgi:predicted secreted hydrolase|nr:MAG: AttH component of AttEFGH ABC transport system [Burkholderiaceae bacterium]
MNTSAPFWADRARADGRIDASRRRLLALAAAGLGSAAIAPARAAQATGAADHDLREPMRFPRDFGSHPRFRTEWWYVTGYAQSDAAQDQREFGFQLTFFRSRVAQTQDLPSPFAARQLYFAHAALTDVTGRRLLHDQRSARASGTPGFDLASASETDTDLRLRDWTLVRHGGSYLARLPADGFGLDLRLGETQPVLLQGDQGLSRKGPQADEISHYYSEPQLAVHGVLHLARQSWRIASGRAWLDHEWSDELLAPNAVGWDWIGMNLHDGGALTAFQVRDRAGNALWDGGSYRSPALALRVFRRGEVVFSPQRRWTSPATGTVYPVQWGLSTPVGRFTVRPVIDDQEEDSRASTGTIYWEGLSDLVGAQGQRVGRGYLELTGYAEHLKL